MQKFHFKKNKIQILYIALGLAANGKMTKKSLFRLNDKQSSHKDVIIDVASVG